MNHSLRPYNKGNLSWAIFGPSSSADVTRAMRGQPKRLSRIYLRRHRGKCV